MNEHRDHAQLNDVVVQTGARARALAFVEVCTVGLPFCVFKVLTGLWLMSTSWGMPLGVALVALGVVDAGLNSINAVSLALVGRHVVPLCVLHLVAGRLWRARPGFADVGLGADTLLSFSLVAAIVGSGVVSALPSPQAGLWSAAVVLNVLGAGVLRLAQALASTRR